MHVVAQRRHGVLVAIKGSEAARLIKALSLQLHIQPGATGRAPALLPGHPAKQRTMDFVFGEQEGFVKADIGKLHQLAKAGPATPEQQETELPVLAVHRALGGAVGQRVQAGVLTQFPLAQPFAVIGHRRKIQRAINLIRRNQRIPGGVIGWGGHRLSHGKAVGAFRCQLRGNGIQRVHRMQMQLAKIRISQRVRRRLVAGEQLRIRVGRWRWLTGCRRCGRGVSRGRSTAIAAATGSKEQTAHQGGQGIFHGKFRSASSPGWAGQ